MGNQGFGAKKLVCLSLMSLVFASWATPVSARPPQAPKAARAAQAGAMPDLTTEIHHLVDLLARSGNMQKGVQNHVYQALHQLLLAMRHGGMNSDGFANDKRNGSGRSAKGKAAVSKNNKGGKKNGGKVTNFASGAGKRAAGKSGKGPTAGMVNAARMPFNSFQMVQGFQLTQAPAQAGKRAATTAKGRKPARK
ncbi:MAG: hypothetical protein FJ271_12510 [Planctomycetes bacterium]|nr:hypothetical protein [Planctomycetota bacterium]